MKRAEYVVSGCLAGLFCRYDGGSNPSAKVVELVKNGRAIPVCPESLSGLPCPRPPCEKRGAGVFSKNEEDVTEAFERGAEAALKIALASGCRRAIIKSRSPSCGFGQIYDGTFSRRLVPGNGVWAQKLADAGFELYDEERLPEDL